MWIREYWDRRLDGLPKPLDVGELENMIEWAAKLPAVFDDVVDRVCQSRPPTLIHTYVYSELADTSMAKMHPLQTLRLLLYLLEGAVIPFYQCRSVEEITAALKPAKLPNFELARLYDRMAELGCVDEAKRLKYSSAPSGEQKSKGRARKK